LAVGRWSLAKPKIEAFVAGISKGMLRNQRALLPLAILDYYWLPGNIPIYESGDNGCEERTDHKSVRYRRKPKVAASVVTPFNRNERD
jgi:hypothetical protein